MKAKMFNSHVLLAIITVLKRLWVWSVRTLRSVLFTLDPLFDKPWIHPSKVVLVFF